MTRSRSLAAPGVLLVLGLMEPLAGCAAGKSFSIAMANPGALQTVLVVGEGDDASSVGSAAPGEVASPQIARRVTAGLPASQAAAVQAQEPTTLALGSPGLAGGRAASVPASMPASTTAGVNLQPAVVAIMSAAPTVSAQVMTPLAAVQVSPPGVAAPAVVAVTGPAAGVTAQLTTTTTSLQVSAPAASLQASAAATLTTPAVGSVLQATTPVAAVAVAANASQGLQVVVSPPNLSQPSSLAPVASAIPQVTRAALTGVSSAALLSAPSPGTSTPTASVLKALVLTATKKLKHG